MKIVRNLYIREFLAVITITVTGLSLIFSLFSLLDKFDNLLRFDPSFFTIMYFTALHVPLNMFYALPIGSLICSIFIFTKAIKRNEIVALKAAGGRLTHLLKPFVLIGVLLSLFAFFLSEFIVPVALSEAKDLKADIKGSFRQGRKNSPLKVKKSVFRGGTLWLKSKDNSIIRIGLYDISSGIGEDIKIFVMDNQGMEELISAEKALWINGAWTLKGVKKHLLRKGETEEIIKMPYYGITSIDYFKESIKKTKEMRIGELFEYILRLRKSGYTNKKLIMDLNTRISYPLINLFMLIIGASIPLKMNRKAGLAAAGLGLVFSIVYWVGYILSLSLGNVGIVSPYIAPWIMPFIFCIISIMKFRNIPE